MLPALSSWLLLIGSGIGLGFSLNALYPRRSVKALVVSSLSSMITLELATHHLLWQLVVTAALVAAGALEQLPGRVGLGLTALSWAALIHMVLQGRRSGRAAKQALSGYVRDLNGPTVALRHMLVPVPFRAGRGRRTRDVVYRTISGRRLKLDVYKPADPPRAGEKRPAVMQIHGGGWVMGDKREQGIPLCTYLAGNGWVVFNVNYRLSPGATFPDHLVDLKAALVWIREHADEYDVDPEFIAVTGGSAGGHLTALMALTQNDPEYQPGFEAGDTSVQAAVPFYGVYDFTNRSGVFPKQFVTRMLQAHVMKADFATEREKYEKASPLDRDCSTAPPFFVIHGDRDTLAPLVDARAFVEKLKASSPAPVVYAEVPGAQHAFDVLVSPRSAPVIEAVERFLDETRRRHAAAGTARSTAP